MSLFQKGNKYNLGRAMPEKTPEDILAEIIKKAKNEGRQEILKKYKEMFDNNLEF